LVGGSSSGQFVDFSRSLINDALKPAFYRLMEQKADQKMKKDFE